MAAYNRWMNEKIYAVCAALTDAERKQDRGAFFGSIHATLNHLLLGDQAWLQRLCGQPVSMKTVRDELFSDFAELCAARTRMDDEIEVWAAQLTDEFADATYSFFSITYQKHRRLPGGWAIVAHLFNHQTHHRGQITTLLSQLGHDVGITDLPWMPRFDAS
jgi:uncharacterized damage-inducible protein DinB